MQSVLEDPGSQALSASGPKPRRSSAFRCDIEGLRGIAILVVVLFHCGVRAFVGGFIGVDVFFVLSGYLITGLLVEEFRKKSRISLLEFYARRARRLLPASALALLITLLVSGLIMAPGEIQFASRAARAAALYMSNMFFAGNADDYFAPSVETNPLLHTWSLAVEEQFYFFWPLLILLGLQIWKSRRGLLWVLSGLTVISLAAGLWLTAHRGTFAFYGLPARAWEFGFGGLAALAPRGLLGLRAVVWRYVGCLGLAVILLSSLFIRSSGGFPGWLALFPCGGTILALLAGAEAPQSGAGRLLDAPPMQFLGNLSYSWYLWHWPFLVLASAAFPNLGPLGRIAAVLAALGMAVVTHHLVENPIRFHPYLMRRPALTLVCAAVLTLVSFGSASWLLSFGTGLESTRAMKAIAAAADDIAEMPRSQCVTLGESAAVKTCAFANQVSPTNMVLFGDSHAIHWFNAVVRVSQSRDWKVTTVLKSGCPATDIVPPEGTVRFQESCTAWRKEAIRTIASMRPALVVVGNSDSYLGRGDRPSANSVSLAEWHGGVRRTLETFSEAGLKVAWMRDVPQPPFDVPNCLARSTRHSWYPGGQCEIEERQALRANVFAAERDAADGLFNVSFVDMTDQLCKGGRCPAIENGVIVYRDDNHLTGSFAARLAPVLDRRLPVLLRRANGTVAAP
jgi:peptidoglycan/LPS O-acetylase OafA/YrhL